MAAVEEALADPVEVLGAPLDRVTPTVTQAAHSPLAQVELADLPLLRTALTVVAVVEAAATTAQALVAVAVVQVLPVRAPRDLELTEEAVVEARATQRAP